MEDINANTGNAIKQHNFLLHIVSRIYTILSLSRKFWLNEPRWQRHQEPPLNFQTCTCMLAPAKNPRHLSKCAVRAGCGAELCNMSAVVVKGFAYRHKVLAASCPGWAISTGNTKRRWGEAPFVHPTLFKVFKLKKSITTTKRRIRNWYHRGQQSIPASKNI